MNTSATDDPKKIYAKIIGDNNSGNYPYRVGLNTLAHNGETFDAGLKCDAGGLYFCELKNICSWLRCGDKLCIVEPVGQVVAVEDKFKTDKLEIVSMMSLLDIETWEFLIGRGVDIRSNNSYALRWATINGRLAIIEFLVEHGADVNMQNGGAARSAAASGRLDILKFLAEHGADIHSFDNIGLRWAAAYGHLDVVKFIVNRDTFKHSFDYSLISAAEHGKLEVVKFLVESGADVHADNGYALMLAAENGHHDVVAYLKVQ